jgi:membrane fusion protein (multidrug efflux system)
MADAASATLERPPLAGSTGSRATLRKRLLGVIAVVVALAGASYGGWYLLIGSHYVSTDNAYVGADVAEVTPMVAGQVISVAVSDTEPVKRDDVLARLDDRDARIALAEAEADLARSKRQVGQTFAIGTALVSQVQARDADIARARALLVTAEAALDKAQIDLDRRRRLAPSGAVSADDLTIATNAFVSAQANMALARASIAQATATRDAAAGDLAANQALIEGTTVGTHPAVLAAQARVDRARLDLERTVVRAPVDGVVTRRSVQVGQRVAPGATVMSIVPVAQLYVDANFKEGQLTRVRPGQAVVLTSDLYGSGIVYHGRVAGFAGGTGASFALIPAQNATGNWIKIVQRLPVRVILDPAELSAHPLRVGLSMDAEIDISDAAGGL